MRVVDLFCGTGGMSLGLKNAGFDIVRSIDSWQKAVDVYRLNLGDHVRRMDLSDVELAVKRIGKSRPDLICGGPPCQDFSLANTYNRNPEGDRADLTRCFAEIVAGVKPRYFLMENVPAAAITDTWAFAKKVLEGAGYRIVEMILDASECGVPQARKRFFVFGSFDEERIREFARSAIARRTEPVSVKDWLGDKIDVEHFWREPHHMNNEHSVWSVHDPAPTLAARMREMNPPPRPEVQHRMDPVHPQTVRGLTLEERGWLQTFPDDWDWGGQAKRDVYRMIGNAVPPKLAEYVGISVKDADAHEPTGRYFEF